MSFDLSIALETMKLHETNLSVDINMLTRICLIICMRITSSAALSKNNSYNGIPHLHFISIAATANVGFGIFPNKMHLVLVVCNL